MSIKKIAYIDDEEMLLEAFKLLFEDEKFEIHTFIDYKAAKIGFHNNTFDIVFCDYRMPEASGLEIIKMLNYSGRLILVTGEVTLADSKHEGVDQVIIKPFDEDQVLKIFQTL